MIKFKMFIAVALIAWVVLAEAAVKNCSGIVPEPYPVVEDPRHCLSANNLDILKAAGLIGFVYRHYGLSSALYHGVTFLNPKVVLASGFSSQGLATTAKDVDLWEVESELNSIDGEITHSLSVLVKGGIFSPLKHNGSPPWVVASVDLTKTNMKLEEAIQLKESAGWTGSFRKVFIYQPINVREVCYVFNFEGVVEPVYVGTESKEVFQLSQDPKLETSDTRVQKAEKRN